MKNNPKILFIVSDFYQSGANRYAYEIDKSLDKSKIDLSILSWHKLNNSEIWNDYYFSKHQALGTPIFFENEINQLTIPTFKERFEKKILNKPLPNERQMFHDFLESFAKIIVIGEYLYPYVARFMNEKELDKTYISIHNSIFQHKENYDRYDKKQFYQFISSFKDGMYQIEFQSFENYSHVFFPLSIHIENSVFKTDYELKESVKIGIFTRLSHTKPLDPFLYAFQLILEKYPTAEFHIYGSGDPEKEGVMRIVKQLDLESKVIFRGHQVDLIATALADNLNLIWLHGYYGIPGGFSGFDICTTKIPQIFWDFSVSSDKFSDPRFPMYQQLSKFVAKSLEIIEDPSKAKDLAEVQYKYIDEEKNVQKFIHILESLFEEKNN
jgi:glycosyltransferase involved in cell wall biosynthesis